MVSRDKWTSLQQCGIKYHNKMPHRREAFPLQLNLHNHWYRGIKQMPKLDFYQVQFVGVENRRVPQLLFYFDLVSLL
jgi:hypothetical protein